MRIRRWQGVFAAVLLGLLEGSGSAAEQKPVKIGLIVPMSGQQASTGRQLSAGAKLYMQEHGAESAGRKIDLIIRDDGGVASQSKRIAQELVTQDKVAVLGGFGLTPIALAIAPIATEAKVPAVIMTAATSMIIEKSPYFVRVGRTMPEMTYPIADWAFKNNIKTVVTLVSDYGPGLDAEKFFKQRFEQRGGRVLETLRVPLLSPDFAPLLQKAHDAKPDALFLFVPSGEGATLLKQVSERGLTKDGIQVLGTEDVADDDQLNGMGKDVIGMVTVGDYSADHDSPENKTFVKDFKQANPGMRPNMMAVAGYDGMAAIYKALEKTHGDAYGAKLVAAMKGLSWTSPRGPMSIDAASGEAVPPMYMRRTEMKNGELYNVEFEALGPVKDPTHTSK